MPVNSPKHKKSLKKDSFAGMKALVMGLGIHGHGSGMEAARYLAEQGAEVAVTDLRDEKILLPSINELNSYPIRYVLGKHEIEDFRAADLVVKNPGVRSDSPYLKAARRIETDISLFLAACPARIIAVTGSKGKSSVSSCLYWTLNEGRTTDGGKVRLGGNITPSPLSFLDELEETDDVVLELSSWQLGDLRLRNPGGKDLLKPRAAIITPIMKDHMDRYDSMEAYVADKRLIYRNQDKGDVTVAMDDEWGRSFLRESRGRPLVYSEKPLGEGVSGGWIENPSGPGFARLGETLAAASKVDTGGIVEVVPERPIVPGRHQKQNLLAAALALLDLGLDAGFIRESLGRFPGIEHRLEFFHEGGGIRFYNDSTATIPEAAAAAITAFEKPPILVCGGMDKELDFSPLAGAAGNARGIILLAGTGSEKLKRLLDSNGVKYRGPFDSLEAVLDAVLKTAINGDIVILSPGCTSFGMFQNEFDRGQKWKAAVRRFF